MPRTRLLHITTVPESLAFLRGQATYMRMKGLEVSAISSPGHLLDSFGLQEGVDTFAVTMSRQITPHRDLLALLRLVRIMRKIRPDIVHAHTPKAGLLGMLASSLARVPVRIYHIRGLPLMTATGSKRTLLRFTEWVSCRLAAEVFCVSHSVRAVAVSEGLCPPDKIKVFLGGSGNGVDAAVRFNPKNVDPNSTSRWRQELGIPSDSPVLGFVGRVVRDKGIVELAVAWRTIRLRFPQTHMIIAGPLEPFDPVPQDVMDALTGDPRVHLVGKVEDTPLLYAAVDVVVLPTYREGFPNVLLEAAAMQKPVVATSIPGCTDAVEDGITGTLVPERSAAALEKGIRAYLENPDRRAEHGKRARTRVLSSFDQEGIWQAVYQAYQRLLKIGD